MLRFVYVILRGLYVIPIYIYQMKKYYRHPENYSEMDCYELAMKVVRLIKNNGRIETYITGTENLPQEGGYIMYANHQGKYDALGVMFGHKKPCTLIIAKKQSQPIVTTQFVDLIRAKRLDFEDIRQQVAVMNAVTEEVKAGRRYLIFPEGGYKDNKNRLQEFKVGSFKCAERAKCPIVPVVVYDSYKPFSINSLRRVRTQVHFLKAIPYEEYAGRKTIEIRDMVVERLQDHIEKLGKDQEELVERNLPWLEEETTGEVLVEEQLLQE
ncbi:MAG: 1-acyl-sn-glycerol-3-phosphate acyltransferase [Firmicutes bacterium]|nr:1-acyl-sn-glycerol-3-phosphate acyltransferase [Bacillota bacterium]